MQESDYKFIQKFIRGHRLPYSKYDDSYLENVLEHKQNNAAAISVCLDALESYIKSPDVTTGVEGINMLYDEMAQFCVEGLFGIGFFGVSVENGIPVRVDSCGMNISKQYRSVYRDITPDQYKNMNRIESMILDQREERKFRQYVLKYKHALANTLLTVLDEADNAERTSNATIQKCLALDQLFSNVCSKIGRTDPKNFGGNVAWNALEVLSDLKMMMMPYRETLNARNVATLPGYTIADLNPVSTTDIKRYKEASSKTSTQPIDVL